MTDYPDKYPQLSLAVDVGGDRYYLGSEKPVELAFKSRQDFLNTFGKEPQIELLIRKYLPLTITPIKKFRFGDKNDKENLRLILEKRAKGLKENEYFTSSVLKNTNLRRIYLNIQKLLELIGKPNTVQTRKPNSQQCAAAKNTFANLSADQKFQIILEFAWYLMHPDAVGQDVQCEWLELVQKLDGMRLGDIIKKIKVLEGQKGIPTVQTPMNYFKRIDIGNIIKKTTKENAIEDASEQATTIPNPSAQDTMKKRLESLLDILHMKKYLTGVTVNTNMNQTTINTFKNQLSKNSMAGGGSTLNKPLGIAFTPIFDYLKSVYDPIYSILEKSTVKSDNILPALLTILHITNNLNPGTMVEGAPTYGVYRISNLEPNILEFFKGNIAESDAHILSFDTDEKKNNFNLQLFKLPKVRLSSVYDTRSLSKNNTFKEPGEIPYIQFFILGQNLKITDAFNPNKTEEIERALNDFFKEDKLYIIMSNSKLYETTPGNIPTIVYDIDYNNVDVSNPTIPITTLPDINVNKKPDLHLDDFITLTDYSVYNDAELALSILIALKERMPM